MWSLGVGLKYVEILEISRKFQGNFRNPIEHKNKPVHVKPKRRSEIRGNFTNFKEISEIQSNIIINLYMWNLSVGLKYVEILEISLKFLEFSHLRIPSAWVDVYAIIVLIDYFLKFL